MNNELNEFLKSQMFQIFSSSELHKQSFRDLLLFLI